MSDHRHILMDGLNLTRGGGVVVMARLAGAFARAGWRVTVLASRPLFDTHSLPEGVAVSHHPKAAGAARSTLFRRFQLPGLCRKLGGDMILSFNYHSPVALPQVTYHINIIPFLPMGDRVRAVGPLRALMQGRAARAALSRSHLNLFESRFIQDLSGAKATPEAVRYIGIDTPPTGAVGHDDMDRTLVSVTSGAPHKRNDQTLTLFRAWQAEHAGAKLVFVGDEAAIRASLSPEDRSFVAASADVSFTGYLNRADLYAQLGAAYALVTSSALESFFMVALEGMAAGCPVLAADTTSAGESLGDAGLIVPAGDTAAALAALNSLTGDSRAALIAKGHARAAAFEADACADGFVDTVTQFVKAAS